MEEGNTLDESKNLIVVFLFLFFILFLLFPFFKWLFTQYRLYNQKISTPAKLINKQILFNKKDSQYILVFQLYTVNKVSFAVSPHEYSIYNSGDQGILVYSKNTFIEFKRRY